MNDLLARFTIDLILAVSWVIAWQQILYADELPGDGFTAGVLMLVTVMLQFVVRGSTIASSAFPPRFFFGCAVTGLVVLFALFVLPLTWGAHPLEHFHVPLMIGQLSSRTLFDLGIFLAIAGSLVTSLTSLREPES